MKKPFFHGSPIKIDGQIRQGTCVSNSKSNALYFALRRRQGDCYLYILQVDPAVDLEQSFDAAGVMDYVLAHDTSYSECILVTDQVISECRAFGASEVARLLGQDTAPE